MRDSIPALRNTLTAGVGDAEKAMYANLTCVPLGYNVFQLQDSLCGQFLGGLDALWLAYAVLGIAAACSIPTLIFTANRLLNNQLTTDIEIPNVSEKVKSLSIRRPKSIKQTSSGVDVGEESPSRSIKISIQ
jgi:hypothetical protein